MNELAVARARVKQLEQEILNAEWDGDRGGRDSDTYHSSCPFCGKVRRTYDDSPQSNHAKDCIVLSITRVSERR